MGEHITVEEIKLLYGHLYQLDVIRDDTGERFRIFIEKDKIDKCEVEE